MPLFAFIIFWQSEIFCPKMLYHYFSQQDFDVVYSEEGRAMVCHKANIKPTQNKLVLFSRNKTFLH